MKVYIAFQELKTGLLVMTKGDKQMKKTFLPLRIWHLIGHLLCAFLAGFGFYLAIKLIYILIVYGQYQLPLLILIMCILYMNALFLTNIISGLHNRVIFYDKKIVITGHWMIKNEGLQFPDEIEYSEIKDVAIICSNTNSLKKRIKNAGYTSLRPFIFYEITFKNDETKWIYIECFSKRQRKLMLQIINNEAGLNLSYEKLERKDYSIYKKRKINK